jgi:bis(5'-nucleosidyl)-tetraphosphatase
MKEEFSVAAVVYNGEEYLLLKYGLGHWGFVKGHKEEGESDEDTILRVLEVESGFFDAIIIKGFQDDYEYYFKFKGETIHKKVKCFLIRSNTKEVKISYEHVDYAWLRLNEAIKRASFSNSKNMLKKAARYRASSLESYLK